MFKRLLYKMGTGIAGLAMLGAVLGAGTASMWNWHQPKLPERLVK